MVSKEQILERVSEKEIMEYYIGKSIKDNRPIYKNPLRQDTKGTCYFKQYPKKYLLVDPADSEYTVDCFGLVMRLYNLTFPEALRRIDFDLNISAKVPVVDSTPTLSIESRTEFDVKLRSWNLNDLDYWLDYNVSLTTLDKLNINPVGKYKIKSKSSSVFRPRYSYTVDDPCYVMLFKKRKIRCKFYRPLNTENKWESNVLNTDLMGWDLPVSTEILYITSGIKDSAVVLEAGYDVRAPQSETQDISKYLIIGSQYKEVRVLYDNDTTGLKYSEKLTESLKSMGINAINITNKLTTYDCKDIADISKLYGLHEVKKILQ